MVTGGAGGIGASIAAALRAGGANLLVMDKERSRADVASIVVDLAQTGAVSAAADEALESLGGCDILVNCAGVAGAPTSLFGLDDHSYQHVLGVNLHAPLMLMKLLGVHMAAAGWGRIVNVTSVHARLSEPGSIPYDISKAGLEAATRTAAIELASSGVLVNAVAPGFVATNMSVVDGHNELESEWFRQFYVEGQRLPIGRAARPEEIAAAVRWLCGPDNSYVTGAVLTVDGGLSARF